jgi:hypothetical protein
LSQINRLLLNIETRQGGVEIRSLPRLKYALPYPNKKIKDSGAFVKGLDLRTGREAMLNRRRLPSMGVSASADCAFGPYIRPSCAQSSSLKIGMLLPFSG